MLEECVQNIRVTIFDMIKVARAKRYMTNCYSFDVVDNATRLWANGDEFIFSHLDQGVERLVFFAESWSSVDKLLELVNGGKFFLEFMTKNLEEYCPRGARLVASMMRLANADCQSVFAPGNPVLQFRDSYIGTKARKEDVSDINHILWSVFYPEISHLLSDEQLEEKVEQITIHKKDGEIVAILQAEVMPKKFYINQVVNRGERKVIHAIMLNCLEEYVKRGGKYLYAWVEENNIASLKFHQKYGMKHDGMWSLIYCLEK